MADNNTPSAYLASLDGDRIVHHHVPSESPVSYLESPNEVRMPSLAADAPNSYLESLEGDRTPAKAATELDTQSSALKEGFDTPLLEQVALGVAPSSLVEEIIMSLSKDKSERSVVLSLFCIEEHDVTILQ